jgi:hypothetical protein
MVRPDQAAAFLDMGWAWHLDTWAANRYMGFPFLVLPVVPEKK